MLNKLHIQLKRIWRSCKNIVRGLINKINPGTKITEEVLVFTTVILAIPMFIILISGLILTVTGLSFFRIPLKLLQEIPPEKEEKIV
jgi:cytochrome b subunit of formate dehydrogenase